MYMHTIDGEAASYVSGEQVCYACRTRPIRLCDSLAQIRKEQASSRKWRIAQGFDGPDYGYLRVAVP